MTRILDRSRSVERLKQPLASLEGLALVGMALAFVHLIMAEPLRPWMWVYAVVGTVLWLAVQGLRLLAKRNETLRRRYFRTVDYSPVLEWLRLLGMGAIIGVWYLLVTRFLLV